MQYPEKVQLKQVLKGNSFVGGDSCSDLLASQPSPDQLAQPLQLLSLGCRQLPSRRLACRDSPYLSKVVCNLHFNQAQLLFPL